jgi:hypothetical protein
MELDSVLRSYHVLAQNRGGIDPSDNAIPRRLGKLSIRLFIIRIWQKINGHGKVAWLSLDKK